MSDDVHALKGPHFVLSLEGDIHGEESEQNRELVRRIHACVNACEGISTDELEKGIIQDMKRVIADVVPLLQSQVKQGPRTTQLRPVVVHDAPVSAEPISGKSAGLPAGETKDSSPSEQT